MTNDVKRARANDEYTNNEFERVNEWGSYLLGPEPDMRWKPGARVRGGGTVVGLVRASDGRLLVAIELHTSFPPVLRDSSDLELVE